MKCILQIICFITSILLIAKLAQLIIDALYDNYGKRYIITDEDGNSVE